MNWTIAVNSSSAIKKDHVNQLSIGWSLIVVVIIITIIGGGGCRSILSSIKLMVMIITCIMYVCILSFAVYRWSYRDVFIIIIFIASSAGSFYQFNSIMMMMMMMIMFWIIKKIVDWCGKSIDQHKLMMIMIVIQVLHHIANYRWKWLWSSTVVVGGGGFSWKMMVKTTTKSRND